MNTLDFDKFGRCVIDIQNAVKDVIFLGNDFFDNSIEALKRDIEVCGNQDQKKILLAFLDICNEDNIFGDEEAIIPESTLSKNIVVGFDSVGQKYASAYNLIVKHSGFWYAAFNIRQEIDNQKKEMHISEGLLKWCDCIEIVLEIIRNANSEEDAIKEICKLGFSEVQAMAVCDYPLNALCGLRKERMSEIILRHERIVSCLEKLAV